MRDFQYLTCCINSTAQLIDDMIDRAITITWETLIKHISHKHLSEIFPFYNNCPLTLKNDYHVSFHRSKYDGQKCYYVVHSGIKYIFVLNPQFTTKLKEM